MNDSNGIKAFCPIEHEIPPVADGPFVSIILRSQGRRPGLLGEALRSLENQQDDSFEILICVHEQSDAAVEVARAKVQEVVSGFGEDFGRKINIINVVGGNRSRPLNAGLDAANGEFVCFLDDDDLVKETHIASLRKADVATKDAHVFHTYGELRKVKPTGSQEDPTYPYDVVSTENHFCTKFSAVMQLTANYVPICNVFVRNRSRQRFRIIFDETFDVLEDWVFLMELNRYFDVVCIPQVTTTINVREDGSNSVNDPAMKDLWAQTKRRAIDRIAETTRCFSPGEIRDLIEISENYYSLREARDVYMSARWIAKPISMITKIVRRQK